MNKPLSKYKLGWVGLYGWNYNLFIMDDYGNAVHLRRGGLWDKLWFTLHP